MPRAKRGFSRTGGAAARGLLKGFVSELIEMPSSKQTQIRATLGGASLAVLAFAAAAWAGVGGQAVGAAGVGVAGFLGFAGWRISRKPPEPLEKSSDHSAAEEKFCIFFENSTDAHLLLDEGLVIAANGAAARMLGFPDKAAGEGCGAASAPPICTASSVR